MWSVWRAGATWAENTRDGGEASYLDSVTGIDCPVPSLIHFPDDARYFAF